MRARSRTEVIGCEIKGDDPQFSNHFFPGVRGHGPVSCLNISLDLFYYIVAPAQKKERHIRFVFAFLNSRLAVSYLLTHLWSSLQYPRL